MALFNKSFLERLASLLALGLILVVFAQPAPLFPAAEDEESEQEASGDEEDSSGEEDSSAEEDSSGEEDDAGSEEGDEVVVEEDEEESDEESVAGSEDEEESDEEEDAGSEEGDEVVVEDEEEVVEDEEEGEAEEGEAEEGEAEEGEAEEGEAEEGEAEEDGKEAEAGVEYELDENGEPLLDEDGNPIKKRKGAKDVVSGALSGDVGAVKGAAESMAREQLATQTGIKELSAKGVKDAAADRGTKMALKSLGLGGDEEGAPAEEPEEAPQGEIKTTAALGIAFEYVQRNLSSKVNRDEALAKLKEIVDSWMSKLFKDQAPTLYTCFVTARDAMKAPGGKLNVAALGGAKPEQHGMLLDAVTECLARQAIVNSFTTSQIDDLYDVLMEATKGSKRALTLPTLDKDYTALPPKTIDIAKVRASLLVQKACGAKIQLRAKSAYTAGLATFTELANWIGGGSNANADQDGETKGKKGSKKAAAQGNSAVASPVVEETMPELSAAGFFSIFDSAVVLAKKQLAWTIGSVSWTGADKYGALADFLKALLSNKVLLPKLSGEAQAIVAKYVNEAAKKAGRVLSIGGTVATIDEDLAVIESGIMANEAGYAKAMADLVTIINLIKSNNAETYASKVYELLDKKALGKLNLRGTINPLNYKKATTYTATFECLKALTKSALYSKFTQQQKERIQVSAIDVQAKIKGAVIDISPFVDDKGTITDPAGFAVITDRMLGNKTLYVAALKNVDMMLKPGSNVKVADIEKVLRTAKTKMAWVVTNLKDFSGKELFKALADTCVNALNKWQAAFGAPMNSALKTFVIETAIRAQAKSGSPVSFSASSVRTDRGLASEGTLSLQVGAVQAAVKASKAATFSAAGDTVIALINAFGEDKPSEDILTQVYVAVKGIKAKCSWTATNLIDLRTAPAYTVVYKVVSAAQPLFAKNATRKAELATWLTNAATKIKAKGGTVPGVTAGASAASASTTAGTNGNKKLKKSKGSRSVAGATADAAATTGTSSAATTTGTSGKKTKKAASAGSVAGAASPSAGATATTTETKKPKKSKSTSSVTGSAGSSTTTGTTTKKSKKTKAAAAA